MVHKDKMKNKDENTVALGIDFGQTYDLLEEVEAWKKGIADKVKGCLVGGAAGDALGYAVEFISADSIFMEYGEEGITEYDLYMGEARISDDTQMTLFTAEGLKLWDEYGRKYTPQYYIWLAYKDWYHMQRGQFHPKEKFTWLWKVPEMSACRAPGNTCMRALSGREGGCVEEPVNDSKGCGGVMRVAPVGAFFNTHHDLEDEIKVVNQVAAEAAALTHGHPMGYLPAAALAHIVNRLIYGGCTLGNDLEDVVKESAEYLVKIFGETPFAQKMADLMYKALALAGNDNPDFENIKELGEGWVGEEALIIAIYCAVRYKDDFSKALCVSVNHSGDSDSTGAIMGNILGAMIGYDAIPDKWKENLECHDVICKVAERLCE